MNELNLVLEQIANFFKEDYECKVSRKNDKFTVLYKDIPIINFSGNYFIGSKGFEIIITYADAEELSLNYSPNLEAPALNIILTKILSASKGHGDYLSS